MCDYSQSDAFKLCTDAAHALTTSELREQEQMRSHEETWTTDSWGLRNTEKVFAGYFFSPPHSLHTKGENNVPEEHVSLQI